VNRKLLMTWCVIAEKLKGLRQKGRKGRQKGR